MDVRTTRGAAALFLTSLFALTGACSPSNAGDASPQETSTGADATADAAPGTDAAHNEDGHDHDGHTEVLNCGEHGEAHGDHCHCHEGYYFNGTTCAAVPACSMANDSLEPNNTAAQATMIPAGATYSQPSLRICPAEFDIFKLNATAGQRITIDLTFTHARGDIDAYLFPPGANLEDIDEADPIAFSDGVVDNERIMHTATAAGQYTLLVVGVGVAENSYGLNVSVAGP